MLSTSAPPCKSMTVNIFANFSLFTPERPLYAVEFRILAGIESAPLSKISMPSFLCEAARVAADFSLTSAARARMFR